MVNKFETLQSICAELEDAIGDQLIDTKLVYYIRGNTSLYSPDIAKSIDRIIPDIDQGAINHAYEGEALVGMQKLLGLLSGVLHDMQLNESAQLTSTLSDELAPTFSLNPKDKERVLDLCAQMRKIVLATEVFDQPHKRRLLDRIAGIEHQVEQPKGLLDIVRAGVSDVGETLGKFGTDIKPLTDRMKEVVQIARSNSKEYEQIPAPEEIKQLPKPESKEDN